jgi:predicted RNase H-like nuclease (RuvC/YqgF family)
MIALSVAITLTSCVNYGTDDWKKRWNEDTKSLAEDIKSQQAKIVELTKENDDLHNKVLGLERELSELKDRK